MREFRGDEMHIGPGPGGREGEGPGEGPASPHLALIPAELTMQMQCARCPRCRAPLALVFDEDGRAAPIRIRAWDMPTRPDGGLPDSRAGWAHAGPHRCPSDDSTSLQPEGHHEPR